MIGKPQRMIKHLISVCKKNSFEDRAMIMEVKEDKSSVSSQSATSGETTAAVEKKQKSNMKSIKAFYKPVKPLHVHRPRRNPDQPTLCYQNLKKELS